MKNINFEGRYVSPEEIQELVYKKFEEAGEHHEKFHEFHIGNMTGYSAKGNNRFSKIMNAIVVIKNAADIVSLRIADGKVIGDQPQEFYLVYKPEKYLVCALSLDDKDTFIKINEKDDLAQDNDITVYMMIHHTQGIFTLYYTPDEAHFTENPITCSALCPEENLNVIAKATKRFFHLPSNFRSLPKENEESENEE